MEKGDQKWTREQTIAVFNLYCKIPFSRATSSHPDIIKIAEEIGRSVNSVKMKIGNFGSFDPELKKRGIVGLANASKLDKEIWNEFNDNWDDLAFESERIRSALEGSDISKDMVSEDDFRFSDGVEREGVVKIRMNQHFFRQAVLSAHNFSCCVTGIDLPELLVASHIVPWSKAERNRLNPRNGLCLNALHDKAFDKGLMTVTHDFKVRISPKILFEPSAPVELWLVSFNEKKLVMPERFVPSHEFIQYHNDCVFQK